MQANDFFLSSIPSLAPITEYRAVRNTRLPRTAQHTPSGTISIVLMRRPGNIQLTPVASPRETKQTRCGLSTSQNESATGWLHRREQGLLAGFYVQASAEPG